MEDEVSPSRRRAVPVLALLVVIGSVVCLLLAVNRPDHSAGMIAPPSATGGRYLAADLPGDAGPALVAAVATLPQALSYNFRQMPYQIQVATSGMTPAFAQAYKTNVFDNVAPLARRTRATATAVVQAAGIISTGSSTGTSTGSSSTGASGSTEEARCLLYVDRQVKALAPAPGTPARTTQRYRVLVVVDRVDGTWKVANISPI